MRDPNTTNIAIVGPCGAGKTVLAEGLRCEGWNARQIAQEHSAVPNMWQVVTQPDVLIYLEAPFDVCTDRKQLDWTTQDYGQQMQRLRHAREHSDIALDTAERTPGDILKLVLDFLEGTQNNLD
jgi:hypothetical protein